jgi:hypothetical protein
MTLAPVFMSRKAPVPYVALVCPAYSATHVKTRDKKENVSREGQRI